MRAGEPVSSGGQLDRAGRCGEAAARGVVEPVDAKEVQRMGRVRIDVARRSAIAAGMVEGSLQFDQRSATRPPPRGSGRAFVRTRRDRSDSFPARAAPNPCPFVVNVATAGAGGERAATARSSPSRDGDGRELHAKPAPRNCPPAMRGHMPRQSKIMLKCSMIRPRRRVQRTASGQTLFRTNKRLKIRWLLYATATNPRTRGRPRSAGALGAAAPHGRRFGRGRTAERRRRLPAKSLQTHGL